jgi:hypothetical protein
MKVYTVSEEALRVEQQEARFEGTIPKEIVFIPSGKGQLSQTTKISPITIEEAGFPSHHHISGAEAVFVDDICCGFLSEVKACSLSKNNKVRDAALIIPRPINATARIRKKCGKVIE